MSYLDFKNKWLGKGIDFDGAFKNQCMDVYRMYVKEVLGVPQSPAVAGAKQVWDTYLKEYFERVANTPDGVPEQGDIVIWSVGKFGHIGICDSADKQYLTTLEQNWEQAGTPQDGRGVTELRKHTYANVLGWLKFKADSELKECLRLLHEVVIPEKEGLQREYDAFKKTVAEEIKSRDDKILEGEQKIKAAEIDRSQSGEELKKLKEEDYQRMQSLAQKLMPKRVDWPAVISEIERLVTVEDQKSAIEKELYNANQKIKGMETTLADVESRLEALQKPIDTEKTKKGGDNIWRKILNWIIRVFGRR